MDGSAAPTDPLVGLLAWIEANRDGRLTLEAIAAHAGLSPYHLSRLFTARMGHSVMFHVRGRKLVGAARRMLADPGLRLIDLALDSGFESQQAFTRAFKRTFGVTPGRFRRSYAITPLEGRFPMTLPNPVDVSVVQLPELAALEAFTVAGFSRRFDDSSKAAIPQLWAQLIGKLPLDGQEPSWKAYGVVSGADREEGSFNYMAAIPLQPGAPTPAGLESLTLPAARYLVFRITLSGGAVHPQIKEAMRIIWGQLVPASGLKVAETPDFELYDSQFAPDRPGAIIDFHVPVEG